MQTDSASASLSIEQSSNNQFLTERVSAVEIPVLKPNFNTIVADKELDASHAYKPLINDSVSVARIAL